MELTLKQRDASKKREAGRLRRGGMIPAVVYSSKGESQPVAVELPAFQAALREIKKGGLPTTLFTLKGESGDKQAFVKDIQYHRTTYDILHLDFQEVSKGESVKVNVPIEYTGSAESEGIKLGGVLRKVIRFMRVSAPPEKIPSEVNLDVRSLNIGGKLRLRDIALPEGVRPLMKMDEVAVVIAKR